MHEFAAFLSYAHANDTFCDNRITQLARAIESEVRQRDGNDSFSIICDREIEWGQFWRKYVDRSVGISGILIPVFSPHFLNSEECRREFELFAERETFLSKSNNVSSVESLVFPWRFRPILPEAEHYSIVEQFTERQIVDISTLTRRHDSIDDEAVTKFVDMCADRIVRIRELLTKTPLPYIASHTVDDLPDRLREYSEGLLNWPRALPDGTFHERDELKQICDIIAQRETSEHYLLGGPGTGKSAILSALAQKLLDDEIMVLAIKADQLPDSINSISELSELILGKAQSLSNVLIDLGTQRRTVLIIDQLDALANLVDLNSGRLNALLDLIAEIRKSKQLHVVASSREFELQADSRLQQLSKGAEEEPPIIVTLKGLKRSQVEQSLQKSDINSIGWPDDYLNALSVPYHLAVFLKTVQAREPSEPASEPLLFKSLRSVHQACWNATIAIRDDSSGDQLERMAKVIADTEVLWHEKSKLGFSDEMISQLESDGWVLENGEEIGFAHQTQYEFVLSRKLASDLDAFIKFVLARENGLFIRPTVWHTLRYMRDADPKQYVKAMSRLLARSERRHLKQLLLDSICHNDAPLLEELTWIKKLLEDPASYPIICFNLRGKPDWFHALLDFLPKLMRRDNLNRWPIARLIESAWPFAESEVRQLLREHWAFRDEYQESVWSISLEAPPSSETLNWLLWIGSKFPLTNWETRDFRGRMIESRAEDALLLLGRILNRRLDSYLVQAAQTNTDGGEHDGSFLDCDAVLHVGSRPEDELDAHAWHDVGKLATSVGAEVFLASIWPWFCRAMKHSRRGYQSRLATFRSEGQDYLWFKRDRLPGSPLVLAIEASIREFAETDCERYQQFVIENSFRNSSTIQRFLAAGLSACAESCPDFVLAFFRDDSRRLFLGKYAGSRGEARNLVSQVVPHWNSTQIEEYENLVFQWNPYDTEETEDDVKYGNQFRAELLWDIPFPQRSDRTRILVEANQEELKKYEQQEAGMSRGMSRLRAVVEVDELASMTDEQVSDLLQESREPSTREARESFRLGVLLAREFGALAKRAPDRGIEILAMLNPAEQTSIAGHIIEGLSAADFDSTRMLAVICGLTRHRIDSTDLQAYIAKALRRVAVDLNGLPEGVCETLESWLRSFVVQEAKENINDEFIPQTKAKERDDSFNRTPILWGNGGLTFFPNDWYPIGESLKLGLCLGEDSKPESWLEIFTWMVDQPFTPDVWEAWLASDTLYSVDRSVIAPEIERLLVNRPDLLELEIAAISIAFNATALGDSEILALCRKLLATENPRTQQAAGELSAWCWLRDQRDVCKEFVDEILANDTGRPEIESARIGIANSAAIFWSESFAREHATDLLVSLAHEAAVEVIQAVFHAFRDKDCLRRDHSTARLLNALSANMKLSLPRDVYWLCESLVDYSQHEPGITLSLIESIVDAARTADEANPSRHAMSEASLVQIALTLHRHDEKNIRERSLTLFEDLFEARAYTAVQSLTEIDRRLT